MRDNELFRHLLSRFQSLLVLVLMIVAMSLLSDRFLTAANGLTILRQISVNVCLSVGMTLVILSGGIDLSVGSVLALSAAVTAGLINSPIPLEAFGWELQFTTLGAIIAGLVVGIFLGSFNGLMITGLKIPPFVATLGMLSIARGLTMLWTKGFPITGLGEGLAVLGTQSALGVPTPVWVAAAIVAFFVLITKENTPGSLHLCDWRKRADFAVVGAECKSHQGDRLHTGGSTLRGWRPNSDVASRLRSGPMRELGTNWIASRPW